MGKIPKTYYRATTGNFMISALVSNESLRASYPMLYDTPEEDRILFGYLLPPFQRPAVWTVEQKERFIESAWMGFGLGTYTVNEPEVYVGKKLHYTNGWLIDGQQRLTAIKEYMEDGFKVYGFYFSELDKDEQRRFETVSFPKATVRLTNEKRLRDLYNRMNYGGTAHTEDQRA